MPGGGLVLTVLAFWLGFDLLLAGLMIWGGERRYRARRRTERKESR